VSDIPVYPSTLWALLARRAGETPERVLIEDEHATLTAAEWLAAAERVAAGLRDRGIGTGTAVAWQMPTTMDAPILMMALARLGAVQIPIIPILRGREVGFIVSQTGASLLITPDVWRNFDYAAMAADIASEVAVDVLVVQRGALPEGDATTLPPPPADGGAIRHVYYTSGSTGAPKGALHTDGSAMHSATGSITGFGFDGQDCVPIPFPITHIGGMAMMVVSLTTGCRLLLIETFDPVRSPVAIAERGGTRLGSAVPFFHAYLAAQRTYGPAPLFTGLRGFCSGGAPTPPELYYEMKDLFGVGILSSWGLTEFPVATSCTADDGDDDLATTEGRVVPGVDLRVVGADGRDVPHGQEGELRLRGPQMFRGYVDGYLDADAFDDRGFFRTGDLGVVGPRGHVRITGRLKDVIIRNAENISAKEVEDLLYTHPDIADVAVIGVPDPRTGERACAVVALADGVGSLGLVDIIEFCRSRHLAPHKIPERLEIVEHLPRNALGKVLKQHLRTVYAGTPSPSGGS